MLQALLAFIRSLALFGARRPYVALVIGLTTTVALPLVPSWGGRSPTAVRLHAEHVEVVDTYRSARP